MKSKLSETQLHVLAILKDGGRLFIFEDGDIGLDDVDGNTLPFRGSTFDCLVSMKLIETIERPALGVEIYGLTETAKNIFNQ